MILLTLAAVMGGAFGAVAAKRAQPVPVKVTAPAKSQDHADRA